MGLVRDDFDVHITPRHVRCYDPTSFQFSAGRKWEEYHAKACMRFESEIASEPIAPKAVRLRRIETLFHQAIESGERTEAAGRLEQAAKEVGGIYTNISKVQGTVVQAHQHLENMTLAEKRNMLADRLGEIIAAARKQSDSPPRQAKLLPAKDR